MKKIVLAVCLVEIVLISGLIFNIFVKKDIASSGVYEHEINKKVITSSEEGGLKFFYEPKPNSVDTETPKNIKNHAKYTINADSLNERYDYTTSKPPRSYRIITLGDSVTYGLYVDTEKNWTELLEDKLNSELKCDNVSKFEIINLGVQGYDNQYSFERFKKRGLKYDADMVIWMQVDMWRVNELMRPRIESIFIDLGSEKTKGYDKFLQARNEIIQKYGSKFLVNKQFESIQDLGKIYKGNVLLVPYWTITFSQRQLLAKEASKLTYGSVIANPSSLKDNGGVFENDPHPNEKGHIIIADDIFSYLKSSTFAGCNSY